MTVFPPSFHLADLFSLTAKAVADRVAISSDQRQLTFAELERRSQALASGLLRSGVQRGQHVGIYLGNCVEYIETFLAVIKMGAVPFNVNYRYQADELTYLFNNADATAIVHGATFTPVLDAIVAQLDTPVVRIAVDDGSNQDIGASLAFETLITESVDDRAAFERSEEDYLLLYTGGTTGMPKGVMWPHRAFFFACLGGGGLFHPSGAVSAPEEIQDRAVNGYALRIMTIAPLMHGAAIWSALAALLGGLTLVLDTQRNFDPEHIWSLVERHAVNIIQIVGDAMAIPLRDTLRACPNRWNLSSVMSFGSGGAVFSAHVKADIQSLLPNVMITDGMGSSETGISGAAEPSDDGMMRLTATDDQQVIVDGRLGGVGQLGFVARSGNIPLGYYKDADKTAAAFQTIDGKRWSVTGDTGRLDDDGKITVFGRGSTCINTGGEKVFPEEVEEVLRAHPGIFDAVVTSKDDDRWGQRVVAILSAREGSDQPSLQALKTFLGEHLAGYKLPREILWVDRVPRSPAGKQDYRWARDYASLHSGLT